MTERTIVLYLLIIILGSIVAGGGVMQAQLNAGQEVNWTAVLAAVVGTVVTGITSTLLPSLKKAAEESVLPTPITQAPGTYPVIHRECGRTAVYALVEPSPIRVLTNTNVVSLDHKLIPPGLPVVCGSCLENLVSFREYHGQWLATSVE